ncbi:hypothetical protein RHS04_01374 [Rhizoctonia solani]|uniref:Uncharacterized protein n=1 Tax=Rhizoctonia solani TaxID=456999 RepID=A0A8H7LKJ8_9AGAM|nr:hypothetical protein RHS04_01374 [Rhizoctonia solani]
MSDNYTPTSVLSSPSSRSSDREIDSDTTPSPSGGNKSPAFNPHLLSNKLAMVQASQALSQASNTLAIAAQAMSKAAALLSTMNVSDYDDVYAFRTRNFGSAKDWVESPDWTNDSYNLLQIPAPRVNIVDPNHKLTGSKDAILAGEVCGTSLEGERVEFSEPKSTPASTMDICPPKLASNKPKPHNPSAEAHLTSTSNQSTSSTPCVTQSSPTAKQIPPTAPSINKVDSPSHDTKQKPSTQPNGSTPVVAAIAPEPAAKPTSAAVVPPAPVKISVQPGGSTNPGQSAGTNSNPIASQSNNTKAGVLSSPTRIILDSGFDGLPALCHITKRFPKTVCLYNYSGLTATLSAAVMVRANVKIGVIVPQSTRNDKLDAATSKFNSAQSGILLWPGCNALPSIAGLASSSNTQLIQLGPPTKVNLNLTCPNSTLILAKSEINQPQSVQSKQYPLDPLNNECNKQSTASLLHSFRMWLRSRLSDDSFARGFYWNWFLDHRRQNPSRNVNKALKLANQYAEQFLLRGESKVYEEPIGGKVTITEGTVKSLKLEGAVQMGIILVSQK